MTTVALPTILATGFARADDAPVHGTVQTTAARTTGELSFEGDGVRVNQTRLRWDDVLMLAISTPVAPASDGPHVIHLVGDGSERWPARVIAFDGKTLQVEMPSLGERKLPSEALTAIDFVADLPWPPTRQGVLVRHEGGPVPSALVRLSEDSLTLDSPLGELEVDRAIARRYVFDREISDSQASDDTLTLVGGVVLHGHVRPNEAGVTIEHRWLGEFDVEWSVVRALRRRTEQVVYLADLEPAEQSTEPLLVESLPISVFVERLDRPDALDAWALQPKLRQVYELPALDATAAGSRRLVAQVRPTERARGSVTLRLRIDDELVWDAVVEPDDEPRMLDVKLGAGATLALEVDYGEPRMFPLGVVWIDPLLLADSSEAGRER